MQRRSTFQMSVLLMAILTFSLSFVTFAQQASIQDEQRKAIADAERDAEARVDKGLWFSIGCLTSVTGTLLAYKLPPSPPVEQFIGKSPDYVTFYTEAYQAKGKSIQGQNAMTGCLVSAGASVLLYLAVELFLPVW